MAWPFAVTCPSRPLTRQPRQLTHLKCGHGGVDSCACAYPNFRRCVTGAPPSHSVGRHCRERGARGSNRSPCPVSSPWGTALASSKPERLRALAPSSARRRKTTGRKRPEILRGLRPQVLGNLLLMTASGRYQHRLAPVAQAPMLRHAEARPEPPLWSPLNSRQRTQGKSEKDSPSRKSGSDPAHQGFFSLERDLDITTS